MNRLVKSVKQVQKLNKLSQQLGKNAQKSRQTNTQLMKTMQRNLFNRAVFRFASATTPNTQQTEQQTGEQQPEQESAIKILNSEDQSKFRNVAIIAHVDHGKTTLVDSLLQHCGLGLNHERSMDGNELEKEKGITILSKCTTLTYQNHKVNLVDTPGHCDFGGEVERIMGMVDSVILLVCATEGPMPQTRYVLQKAIKQGIKPIVVVNKVDRPTARPEEVVNEVFDLMCDLEIDDSMLDYEVFFCSGRDGWAVSSVEDLKSKNHKDISVIMNAIIDHVPAPTKPIDGDLKILVSQTESNKYFGKMVIGRIESGTLTLNDKLQSINNNGEYVEASRVQKIIKKYGMEQIEMNRAVAGDIVSIAGFSNSTVTDTLNNPGKTHVIPSVAIDPPIISVALNVNSGPLAGKEGNKMSKNQIKERLIIEAENDVALKLEGCSSKSESSEMVVKGRGDLHLGILFETMRREGFEIIVTPPKILFKEDTDGSLLEPVEKITIECDPQYVPSIIEKLGNRGAIYENCTEITAELHKLEFVAPTRGLIGFRSVLQNDTKGTANMEQFLQGYEPHRGNLQRNNKGALISSSTGMTTAYAIAGMEQFGQMFIRPNQQVYQGMVIGEHNKEGDQELNPTKAKQLTNIRTKAADEKIVIQPHRKFTVEEAVSYIREDEQVEVTPKEIRIRKRELNPALRKREQRDAKSAKKSKK